MTRNTVLPALMALGLGACALENPQVVIGPGSTLDAAIDLGFVQDVAAVDRPAPMDLGFDAGRVDVGVPDTGVVDTGVVDTGVVDTGVVDTGVVDTGVVDTGVVDTGVVDTGVVDTGVVDTGVVDTGVVDTGVVDAGVADVPSPTDTGGTDVPVSSTCGSEGQGCCAAPATSCRAPLTCQLQLFAPSRCLPCGGQYQACCAGGACRTGPCVLGVCIR